MSRVCSEFTCKDCGHEFNKLQDSDTDNFKCPRCGSKNIEKNRFFFDPNSDELPSIEDYYTIIPGGVGC